jgi:hypothetical protein
MSHPDVQTIDDLLSDSLIQAVMRADGVETDALRRLLKTAVGRRQRAPAPQVVRPRVGADRRALPSPAALRLLPPQWLAGCAAGVCG